MSDHYREPGFEIGSGEGIVAAIIGKKCRALDCLDISEYFLNTARLLCGQQGNITFHLIENDYLRSLPSSTYDFGFAMNVFIHFNPYDIYNYLYDVSRVLKPGGVFLFDAATLGHKTIPLFKQAADAYRQHPETIRGLMNFNHPEIVKIIIDEVGLHITDKSVIGDWMKILVKKPG